MQFIPAINYREFLLKNLKVDPLEISPEMGRIVPEYKDKYFRELFFGNYRIIYRIEKKQISIITVIHGKQILPVKEILNLIK